MPDIGARLTVSWAAVEEAVKLVAEHAAPTSKIPSGLLQDLGLQNHDGTLTPLGENFHSARFVLRDDQATGALLQQVLLCQPVATAFCSHLWGRTETVAVAGAMSLLKRLTEGAEDAQCKRWLELMGRAGWIAYNRNKPTIRVLFNPDELLPPDEEAERASRQGHFVSRETAYGNLFALRKHIRAARGTLRWYEQHLGSKVLEVLYPEVDGRLINEIRLLSGPANINETCRKDFSRFKSEMAATRSIQVEWRVLDKGEARQKHDRFLLSSQPGVNLPPLNNILAGDAGEILPSAITAAMFDDWYSGGVVLEEWQSAES